MPSVSYTRASAGATRAGAGALLVIGASLLVCGCASTQTTAARLQLNDDRLRAAQEPIATSTVHPSATVSAADVTVLASAGHFTAVVSLHNAGSTAVSDLPVLVGYRAGRRTVLLNAGIQASYFDNHTPGIAAHASLDWVDSGSARIPRQARFFATVGGEPAAPLPAKLTLPQVTATVSGARITVHNTSSITQYQVPVYAVLTRAGRIVSASVASVAVLDGGATAHVRISRSAVSLSPSNLRATASATIFK